MKAKPVQKRIERKLVRVIEKIQKENEKRTGVKCSFSKASGLYVERNRKR